MGTPHWFASQRSGLKRSAGVRSCYVYHVLYELAAFVTAARCGGGLPRTSRNQCLSVRLVAAQDPGQAGSGARCQRRSNFPHFGASRRLPFPEEPPADMTCGRLLRGICKIHAGPPRSQIQLRDAAMIDAALPVAHSPCATKSRSDFQSSTFRRAMRAALRERKLQRTPRSVERCPVLTQIPVDACLAYRVRAPTQVPRGRWFPHRTVAPPM